MAQMDLPNHDTNPSLHRRDLAEDRKAEAVRQIFFLNLLKEIDATFAARKIPLWIIKGPAIGYRYYDAPEKRSYTDIDLFVEGGNWEKSLQALKDMGGKPTNPKKWYGSDFRCVFTFQGFPVEIHRQLMVERPLDYMFTRESRPTMIPGITWMREPCVEDLFVYLCGHGAFQHLFDEILWLYDLNLLLIKEKNNFDWQKLQKRSEMLRLNTAVGVTLVLLEKYFGHEIRLQKPIGNWFLRKISPIYLHPERIRKQKHLRPRFIYLLYKTLMRDSFAEAFYYGLKRISQ